MQRVRGEAQYVAQSKTKYGNKPQRVKRQLQINYALTNKWDANTYASTAGFVAQLGQPVLDLLDAQKGERVLDLGCGDGALTLKLKQAGATVVAVDSSTSMVEACKQKGLDAHVVDGQQLQYNQEFDAVFSNAALHWMTHPEEVVLGVKKALVPGGRFVGEFGGFGNVAAVRVAIAAVLKQRGIDATALCPWYFPDDMQYKELLEGCGFNVNSIELITRQTKVEAGFAGWLETFGYNFFKDLEPEERTQCVQEVAALLEPVLTTSRGIPIVDYVRLRFIASIPR